jgi:DNA gyrase inhibitor GyrI
VRINFVYMRPTPVLFFGAVGPYEKSATKAWERMLSWLESHDLRRAGARGFGIIHDHSGMAAAPHRRYDACVELLPGFAPDPPNGIVRKVTPSGAYAQMLLKGCHGQIAEGFRRMREQWSEEDALIVDETRPYMEIFLNDPGSTPKEELLTELCVPVRTTLRVGKLRPPIDP